MNKKIRKWIDKNIHINLNDKNVFITGANSGIGFETAREFAYLNANIFMLVRNLEKGNSAKNKLLEEFPNCKIVIIELNLASINSIYKAIDIIKQYDIDIFVNNAGVYRLPKSNTEDGFEITMGTNYLGVLYLNDLLNKYFISLNHPVYNIFTTSITSKISKIDYDDFFMENNYNMMKIYGRSKLAVNNTFFTYIDEYKDSNIIFSLVHPGGVYTPLIKKAYRNKVFEFFAKIFMSIFFHHPEKAALITLKAVNNGYCSFIGPRGLFEMSGFPKNIKFKRDANYLKCTELGRKHIFTKLEENE